MKKLKNFYPILLAAGLIIVLMLASMHVFSQLPRVYGPTDKPTIMIIWPSGIQGDTIFCYVKADKNYITGKYAWNQQYGINLNCEGYVTAGNPTLSNEPVRTGAEFGEIIYLGMLKNGKMYEVLPDNILWPARDENGVTSWMNVNQLVYFPTTVYQVQTTTLGDEINIELSEVPKWDFVEPPEPDPEPVIEIGDFDVISYQDDNFVVGIKNGKLAIQNLSDSFIKYKFGDLDGWRKVSGGLESGEFKTLSRAATYQRAGILTLRYSFNNEIIEKQFEL